MSSTSESITIAYVAAVPTSSRLASEAEPDSSATQTSSAAPQPSALGSDGSGAETMPLTWPIRSWACGIATMTTKRNSAGTTLSTWPIRPSCGR